MNKQSGFSVLFKPIKEKYPIGATVTWACEFPSGLQKGEGIITGYDLHHFQEGVYSFWAIIDAGRKEFLLIDSDDPNFIPAIKIK